MEKEARHEMQTGAIEAFIVLGTVDAKDDF